MIIVDGNKVIVHDENGNQTEYDIGSARAFRILSQLWLRSGWDTKYVYGFTWLGRPIIQYPQDLVATQEIVWATRPEVMKGWHTFGLLWLTREYVFYVDGQETWRTSAGGVSQVPEFIKLTEEIGKWGGKIQEASLPDYCEVDYVRVYEAKPKQSN